MGPGRHGEEEGPHGQSVADLGCAASPSAPGAALWSIYPALPRPETSGSWVCLRGTTPTCQGRQRNMGLGLGTRARPPSCLAPCERTQEPRTQRPRGHSYLQVFPVSGQVKGSCRGRIAPKGGCHAPLLQWVGKSSHNQRWPGRCWRFGDGRSSPRLRPSL